MRVRVSLFNTNTAHAAVLKQSFLCSESMHFINSTIGQRALVHQFEGIGKLPVDAPTDSVLQQQWLCSPTEHSAQNILPCNSNNTLPEIFKEQCCFPLDLQSVFFLLM